MSRRIGEILIDKGVLTPEQLERALKAQLIFGGHLGTSLIELGYVDEATLGETLSEITGAPYASAEVLLEVPAAVIQTVPAKLAEQHRVVPIRLRERNLLVAAVHPRDLNAMDEIAFGAGYKVIPWVAPEIRIFQALERYYGIRRPPRYVTICRELDQRRGGARARVVDQDTEAKPAAVAQESPMPAGAPAPTGEAAGAPSATSTEPAPPATRVATPITEAAAALAAVATGEAHKIGDLPPTLARPELANMLETTTPPVDASKLSASWKQIVDQAATSEQPDQRPSEQMSPPMRQQALERVAEQLAEATDGEDVARAALSYLSLFAPRCILFSVREASACVWRSSQPLALDAPELRKLRFPVLSGSVFELLLGNEYFRGPLPGDYGWVYGALKLKTPAEVLMIPVHVEDRLALILYADGGPGGAVGGDVADYLRFSRKVAMTLSMLILRSKIRAV